MNMKRLVAMLVILAALTTQWGAVSGALILDLNFDHIRFINVGAGSSGTVVYPYPVCVLGAGAWESDYTPTTITISVNGTNITAKYWYSGGYTYYFGAMPEPLCGSSFLVKVTTVVPNNTVLAGVDEGVSVPYKGILIAPQKILYSAPGAEGSPQGLLLNATQLELNQTFNLTTGAISFWLKYGGEDGTILYDSVTDTPVVQIKNGQLVVRSSAQNYTFAGSLPIGVYVPVYIGFEAGKGYIIVNTTQVNIVWDGNLVFDSIGYVKQHTNLIIDQMKVYDNYVPPDVFLSGSPTAQVVVKTPNYTQTLNITTMDGSSLSNISVSLFSSNWTLLNTTSWSFGETPTVFANTTGGIFAVITGTASTTVYLQPENGSVAVAIPGNAAQYISATIEPASYPSAAQRVWDWLTVKDVNGRIVYRNKWNFQPTSVILQAGKAYLIEVSNDNFTETQVVFTGLASPDIKINLPTPGELTLYDNLTTYYKATNDSLQIYYYDPQHITEWVRLEMFDVAGRTLLNVTYPYTNLLNFKTNIVPYRFTLTFYRDGHKVTWSRVVGYVSSGKDNPFFLDRPLTSLIILLMVLFSFDALSSAWAPIITLVTGIILSIPGITVMPLPLVAFLSTSAFLAFLSKANIQFYSVKQLASQMFVLILLLQVAGGIAAVLAAQLGIPHDQFGVNYLAEQGKEQLVFWSNYTPQYTSLGAPVPTDAKSFWTYMGAVFNGAKYTFMSLGAPESIANALQVVFWALEAALGLYILLGREV